MEAKHTPGPWSVVVEDGDTYLRAPGVDGLSKYETLMCNMAYYPWINFTDGDWRLVAAAPELLEALRSAANAVNVTRACLMDSVETHKSHGGWLHTEALRLDSELDVIHSAIAKATGEAK